MTTDWEAAVEAQIRSAQERGEFDNLPGAGKPIPGRDMPYDEGWWIRSFMEREQIPSDLLLPTRSSCAAASNSSRPSCATCPPRRPSGRTWRRSTPRWWPGCVPRPGHAWWSAR